MTAPGTPSPADLTRGAERLARARDAYLNAPPSLRQQRYVRYLEIRVEIQDARILRLLRRQGAVDLLGLAPDSDLAIPNITGNVVAFPTSGRLVPA